MPPTPTLKLRKNIWTHFPVSLDAQGRGANGAERHCVEWHNTKVRQMAKEAGKTEAAMKAEILPRLLRALTAAKGWTVEAPEPGSKCVAVLAMKFAAPKNNVLRNATRRLSPANRNNRKSPSTKPASPTRKSANRKSATNATRKAPKNYSALEGDALLRKAKGLMNLMSEATVDRLSKEFATLKPRTVGDYEKLMHLVAETALDQQAYHPLIIHLLHVLDSQHSAHPYPEKPSATVVARIFARVQEEPLYAKMEVDSEETNSPPAKKNAQSEGRVRGEPLVPLNLDDQIALQKRFFRSATLFAGFLYRDGFATWASYKPLLRRFASMAFETDPADLDYRIHDGFVMGLLYMLVRSGAYMAAEGGEAAAMLASLTVGIQGVAKGAKRGAIRTAAAEFLETAAGDFKIKPGMIWTVGAPMTDVRVRAGPAAAKPKAEGLGADIGELWRRFPLDVKQDGAAYVVRFHNKKLRERYEKEGGAAGRYKTVADLEAALTRQILGLIAHSEHWQRQKAATATPAGVLVVIEKKK